MSGTTENLPKASDINTTDTAATSNSQHKWSARRHWITWASLLAGLIVISVAVTGFPLNAFWPAPTIPEANVVLTNPPPKLFSSAPRLDYPGATSDTKKAGWIYTQPNSLYGYHSDLKTLSLVLNIEIDQAPWIEGSPNKGKAVHLEHGFKNAQEGHTYTYGPITVKILKFWKPPYPWYEPPWPPYPTDYYQVTFDETKITWPANTASWQASESD